MTPLRLILLLFIIGVYCIIFGEFGEDTNSDDPKLWMYVIGAVCFLLELPLCVWAIFHYIKI